MPATVICPNCGGANPLHNPGVVSLLCEHCGVALHREDRGVRVGERAMLIRSDSRLALGARGRLEGEGFVVIGRLALERGDARLDEWRLRFEGGRLAWLAETRRELSLLADAGARQPVPEPSVLAVGARAEIEGRELTVRAAGRGTVAGFEGQIDFLVAAGQGYEFAELASPDGRTAAVVERRAGGEPVLRLGRPCAQDDLEVVEVPEPEAVVFPAVHVTCSSCGAPLRTVGGRGIDVLVCRHCGAQLDLTTDAKIAFGRVDLSERPPFLFEVGARGVLGGAPWEVCGRIAWRDNAKRQVLEYLLFNPQREYLRLEQVEGHFVLSGAVRRAPETNVARLAVGDEVDFDGRAYRCHESGFREIEYVDGALPWRAVRGYRHEYVHLVAPPRLFREELHERRLEYYDGTWLARAEVERAFGVRRLTARPAGVHGAQPLGPWPVSRITYVAAAAFVLLDAALGGLALALHRRTPAAEADVYMEGFDPLNKAGGRCGSGREIVVGPLGTGTDGDYLDIEIEIECNTGTECGMDLSWALASGAGSVLHQERVREVARSFRDTLGGRVGENTTTAVDRHFRKGGERSVFLLLFERNGYGGDGGAPQREPSVIRVRLFDTGLRLFAAPFWFPGGLLLLFLAGSLAWHRLRPKVFERRRWLDVKYGLDTLDLSAWDHVPVGEGAPPGRDGEGGSAP